MADKEQDVESAPLIPPSESEQGKSSHEVSNGSLSIENGNGNKDKAAAVVTPPASKAKIGFACALQIFCGVSMVLTNKSLAFSYNHLLPKGKDLNVLLVVFQAAVAVVCVEFCKFMKWVDYPSLNLRTVRLWAPVNVLFCAMLFTGMASLQHNNVPMVTVFKNMTNLVITAGDAMYFEAKVTKMVLAAFAVMLGGACLAAVHDVELTFAGLFWMGANCLCTAGYILYMKFATNTVKMSKFGMVFYNNVLCFAFLLPAAILRGDLTTLLATTTLHTPDYLVRNVFAGFVGFFLNFSSLNCVAVTGPTTYAVIGTSNKIPISILGAILFGSNITAKTWFFVAVNLLGGFLYSYAKLTEDKAKPQPEKKR